MVARQAQAAQADRLRDQGQVEEAARCYASVVAATPGDAIARCKLGLCLRSMRRYEEALAQFDMALALLPDLSMAHMDRGNVLSDLHKLEEALASYERAIRLAPLNGLAHCNYAIALRDLGRHEDALVAFAFALRGGAPAHVVFANRGATLTELRRFDEALHDFSQALAVMPDFALAHWNESLCRLVTGDMDGGWPKFEWRWRYADLGLKERRFPQPLWRGDADPSGRTLLVYCEQGLGDTLQFCRYVPLLAARGARVLLQVPSPIEPLIGALEGVCGVVAEDDPLPGFDAHVPLLSLPLAFRTTLATIPAQVPYLSADSARVASWSQRLGPRSNRKRIGLAWSGRPTHRNDRNRSISVASLASLLDTRFEWIGVQNEIRESDQDPLASLPIRSFGAELRDLADTAALMTNLDLIITVDTAAAHLAGALGRPVWILLPYAPDWRWLIGRSDSPWYPTARLFRQSTAGNWNPVLQEIDDALSRWRAAA